MANEDISAELGGMIANAEVYGSSDNFRHGKYVCLIKTIRAQRVKVEAGEHRFVFWEMEPTISEPNPRIEGDRVDYVSKEMPGTGPLKDDGTHPNEVGSNVALKIDFDGAGARSAPANGQAPILALFNKSAGQIGKDELNSTFLDLSRMKPVRKGDAIGFDLATKQVIYAAKDMQSQMARGMLIGMKTSVKKKGTPNEWGMYITKLNWYCYAPIGQGENSLEKIKERRAIIETGLPDEDEDVTTNPTTTVQVPANLPQMPVGASAPPAGGVSVPATPPQPTVAAPLPPAPPAPPAPPSPPVVPWQPTAPWRLHPSATQGTTPDQRWYWDGASGVKSESQLRSGQ